MMERLHFSYNPDVERLDDIHTGVDRVVCVILADVSGSMSSGGKIDQVNKGLLNYIDAVESDDLARQRVETSVITFGDQVTEVITFAEVDQLRERLEPLTTDNCTSMNEAILTALKRISDRKQFFVNNGINYFRPWIFLLTDGLATDTQLAAQAQEEMKTAIKERHVVFFPLAIGDNERTLQSTVSILSKYVPDGTAVFSAGEANFGKMFQWLSNSMVQTGNSNPAANEAGIAADLPSDVGLRPWRFDPNDNTAKPM